MTSRTPCAERVETRRETWLDMDPWGPSKEAAIKGGHRGRYWHRLRSRYSGAEVDGIPVIHDWIPCGSNLRLIDAVTRWGVPDVDACPSCWGNLA